MCNETGSCKGCCKNKCICRKTRNFLLIVGGLNWGLVGVGMLMDNDINAWNFIHKILVSLPIVEGIIYVLVGIAALMKIFSFRCKKCVVSCCGESKTETSPEGSM